MNQDARVQAHPRKELTMNLLTLIFGSADAVILLYVAVQVSHMLR